MRCSIRRSVALLAAAAVALTACERDEPTGGERPPDTATGEPTTEPTATGEPTTEPTAEDERDTTSPAGGADGPEQPLASRDIVAAADDAPRLDGIVDADGYVDTFGDEGIERWQQDVAGIEEVTITSTADGAEQPALWLAPADEGSPLLVGLHTWSTPYLQHLDIPFGRWARELGWGFVHPNFRGANNRPEATGSDLAVQDVVDAIDFAIDEGGVDPERVYAIGFSGGGMMSLLLAGRHPDRVTAVVAWAANYDLVDWHRHTSEQFPGEDYADWLEASCGGDPSSDPDAEQECLHRSPVDHLDAAREAGVPVYVAHGLDDELVPTDHAVRAFDQLAAPEDRLGEDVAAAVLEHRIPDELDEPVAIEPLFGADEPDVHLARSSGPAMLVLYEGDHSLIYHPGLAFLYGVHQLVTGD